MRSKLALARLLMPFHYLTMSVVTVIVAPFIIGLSLLGLRRLGYAPIKLWCRVLRLITGVGVRVRGLEHVPTDGCYVIIANHCSHLDGPMLILALPHAIYFVIKRELTRLPIWGQAVVAAGFIAVDRSDSEKAHRQLRAAVAAIRAGRTVLVFPEGTRSPDGSLLPFKKGGFHLAVDAQVPILPVVVNHSGQLLPKGASAFCPGTLEVIVAPPIPTVGLDKDHLPELIEQTRATIAELRRSDPDFRE